MFSTRISSKLLALGAAGALTLGVVGGGVAYAHQSSGGTDATPAAAQLAAKASPAGMFKSLLADIIKQSGLTRTDFATGFKNGQTINQILTAKGKDPATVEAAVAGDVNARIDQALQNNKITQARATNLKSKVQPTLDKVFGATPKLPPLPTRVVTALRLGRHELDVAAQTMGISTQTLVQDLRNGQSIAQVAGDKTPAVITAVTSDVSSMLDKALANGKITQAQHDNLEKNLPTRISNFVNKVHIARPGSNTPATAPSPTPGQS